MSSARDFDYYNRGSIHTVDLNKVLGWESLRITLNGGI